MAVGAGVEAGVGAIGGGASVGTAVGGANVGGGEQAPNTSHGVVHQLEIILARRPKIHGSSSDSIADLTHSFACSEDGL